MKKSSTFLFTLCLILLGVPLAAQMLDKVTIAEKYAEKQMNEWHLKPTDVKNMIVTDQYSTKHNGATHIFFKQSFNGIEVKNATMGIHLNSNNQVVYATQQFVSNLSSKAPSSQPTLTAKQAIQKATAYVGASLREPLHLIKMEGKTNYLFSKGNISNSDIPVKLVYYHDKNTDEVFLAWDLSIDQIDSPDYWSLRISADDGRLLEKNNWTVYCQTGAHNHADCQQNQPAKQLKVETNQATLLSGAASYNVFPMPYESPLNGNRQLEINPADDMASPFGWHDINGETGAEFLITRGNNVHAYLDTQDSNSSAGDEPDGGPDLLFDFAFDQELEPAENQAAAITQLFYMCNKIHDFNYHYGFDEAAGNFQQMNYSGQGQGGDGVLAEGQDGSGDNNANFSTPNDGGRGRMQMFLWDRVNGKLLNVIKPTEVSGGYQTGTANFGPALSSDPIEGQVVLGLDASPTPTLGCETTINTDEVAGKIAMVDRGVCFFEEKVLNLEAAGAIAVIICNFEEGVISMGGGVDGVDPNIPSVMLKNSDCQLFKQLLDDTVVVRLVLPDNNGPEKLDACFDNGVVAHEYGHGISNRLTGGPSNSDCLFNDEQMGEGWSDFFALVQTVQPGDVGSASRGMGNYLTRAGLNGGGIRRLPYSTDFNINDQTYDDIIGTTAPHPLGEIWTGVLWDMYWALVDKYGFDEDQVTGTGGNNIAIQLVMDGMKLQGCNPGFIEGRNAILSADLLNNNGDNQCLIWGVFARRGLGFSADGGSPANRNDGREGYDLLPACVKELKIKKEMTPIVIAGDLITCTITIGNDKGEMATGVVVTDEIPEGTEFIVGSETGGITPVINGNMISFDIGDMPAEQERVLTYQLSTSVDFMSLRQYFDDMESGDEDWLIDALEGIEIWGLSDTRQRSGQFSWFVPDDAAENDQVFYLAEPILVSGEQPTLRFHHWYDTEFGADGGFVEISTDGGASWNIIKNDLLFKNPYRGSIAYGTFAIPDLKGFWGNSGGFIDTYIDLSPYLGEEVSFRFRFGSDAEAAGIVEPGEGWYIDDIEVIDMVNYNGEACISSDTGDMVCTIAPSKGSIVETFEETATNESAIASESIKLYPNPASDLLTLNFEMLEAADIRIEIVNNEGKITRSIQRSVLTGDNTLSLDISSLPAGFYYLKMNNNHSILTQKFTIK